MSKKKNILVVPLNWGLGHTTRCIAIIRELLAQDASVLIGGDGMALAYLKNEFPDLLSINIPDLKVRYPKSGGYLLYFALRIPKLFTHVKKENQALKKLVREYQIDGIISDNRYGLYHASKPSILITHQLFIETPSFKKTMHGIVKKLVSKFTECWVPDIAGSNNLSGNLSHLKQNLTNVKFIGPLSRFTAQNKEACPKRTVIAILSGPEPFRTKLEELLIKKLSPTNFKSLIVRGVVSIENTNKHLNKNVSVIDYISSAELLKEIEASEFVIARSGYSTIMDLDALQQKALLIPTPGQTEQEYLAQHLASHSLFTFSNQESINLQESFDLLRGRKAEKQLDAISLVENIAGFLREC